ncbi:hypothetical protein ACK8P5_25915 (plasmid) [Paenibacillus sp. EC2-1]|uniref:hypothetical protein n=1 Tax=Paenibacillus sp. EC2-1 TaxID=3388665 RepID=UPI003BEEE00F
MKFEIKYANSITGESLQVIENVIIGGDLKPCAVCEEDTAFVDISVERRICSEECSETYYNKIFPADHAQC